MSKEIAPFPFPFGYWLNPFNKLGDRSIKEYIKIFEKHRNERPNGKFAAVDIAEIMKQAEDMGGVDSSELSCIVDLTTTHPDYFSDDAQKQQLLTFADNHEVLQAARKDDIAKDLVSLVPLTFYRDQKGAGFLKTSMDLSAALKENDAYYAKNGSFDPNIVHRVNTLGTQLREFVDGLTLSDLDKPAQEARAAFLRDALNIIVRVGGKTDHEAKWDGKKWTNWNRDIVVYPQQYKEPTNCKELCELVQREGSLRMVGGGHAFNNATSMGGQEKTPAGTLVTLDKYRLAGGAVWMRMDAAEAIAKYKTAPEEAQRVVRAAGGVRLRDFGKLMWNEGMALPVAGSTDAQSIAGLIATDLHSTGKFTGFLSSQLLELTVISGSGQPVLFTKDESIPRGTMGRWRFTPPGQTEPRLLSQLPVSGAIGTLGIVAEVVLKLDAAYNMRKSERFVPIAWAEDNIERLLNPNETEPLFAYDHVSFYYTGGGGPIRTVRMNAWNRTTEPLTKDALDTKKQREILDLVGSGFLPDYLVKLAQREAMAPGQSSSTDEDFWIKSLNNRTPLILPANEGFARKLFFQHDEIEVGLPLSLNNSGTPDYNIFRNAVHDTLDLLTAEEFRTIIEVRFTPDLTEAMLGPGANGPTCYIELASALGDYSKTRIYEVYDAFETLMRTKYSARPHLGKKTSFKYADLSTTYGPVWQEFQAIRSLMDPGNKFLPAQNSFLTRIFVG